MHDLPTGVVNDKKDIDCPEEDRFNAEEVAGPNFAGVRAEKLSPTRRWFSSMDAANASANRLSIPYGAILAPSRVSRIKSGFRQRGHHRDARIQNRRSGFCNRDRGRLRCRTRSCCRRQRFSATNDAFGFNNAAMARTTQRAKPPSSFSFSQRKLFTVVRSRKVAQT